MSTNAGIWIDYKQAIVVLVTDAGKSIKKIPFDIGQPVRSAGKSRSRNKSARNDFVAEDTLERRIENDRKDYFDDVLISIQGAAAVLILGPGEAKAEFVKRIKTRKLFAGKVELETADKMTDPQLAAKVSEHFTKVPARKTVAPSKAAKAMLGKRTKKSRK